MSEISKEKIEEIICNILYHDGPDMHTDGSDVITSFIMALLDGKYSDLVDAFDKSEKFPHDDILNHISHYEFKELFHKEN